MKNILVAGGAGFIGSHLCEALLAQGHRVTGVDSLITGTESNLKNCWEFEHFRFIQQDICENWSSDTAFDEIYNLACPASPDDFHSKSIEIMKACSIGHQNLLELAHSQGAKILLTSSSEVYGHSTRLPHREDDWGMVNPIGPRSCYDEGKRFAEALTTQYIERLRVDAKIVRLFNCYGPRMKLTDGRVIPSFIQSALTNAPFTIHDEGFQTRSFCYVDDIVRGIQLAMDRSIESPLNLGNPDEISILSLAKKVKEITRSKSPLQFAVGRKEDPPRRRPCIERATTILNWSPLVSIEDGLKKTIFSYQDNQPSKQKKIG